MFSEVIDNLMATTEKNNVVNEGDYYDEKGLLYCGKCGTAKQVEVTILGQVRRPYCLCKCESERLKQEEENRKQQELKEKKREVRRKCFNDEAMQGWTFANDDMSNEKVTKAMQNYVDNFPELKKQGKGLLLYGQCGTGKTYAACEVANALIDKGYSVLVTNFARVLNSLQGTFDKQDYIDEINSNALLVLDDLGIERDTQYAKEQVFNIIDARYRAGLPMIITTNLTMDKIKATQDIDNMRIYDRILERCFPIEVAGENRRRKAIRESYGDMKTLLGL
jgi:DNA replication protein DnaC